MVSGLSSGGASATYTHTGKKKKRLGNGKVDGDVLNDLY